MDKRRPLDKSVGIRDGWTPNRVSGLEIAEGLLKDALRYAVANGAPRTADKIRSAIKSIQGAIRHADGEQYRAAKAQDHA